MSSVSEKASRFKELLESGQSYWLDNLTRDMIESGELEKRVSEEGLRGVTSNPKTFADSVSSGSLYDNDIARLAKKGESDLLIYETLMVDDVRRGCDALMPVYESSGGEDGFVSIEVDPRLSRQTEATLDAARMLWKSVDRRNVMVKIPGTKEGLDAIEETLYEGINVNITLLFSKDRYREVAARYLRALDRRRKDGRSIEGISSVASFFLSRIDVLVDELLGHRMLPDCSEHIARALRGKAALAQACLAYRSFREAFSGSGWELLKREGASVQRPLWASTSVKQKDYPDTMYIDSLVAEHTVNTMPETTIEAFADHGVVVPNAIASRDEKAAQVWDQLEAIGIDLDYVSQRLEDEGVQKFIDPFTAGLAAISKQAARSR